METVSIETVLVALLLLALITTRGVAGRLQEAIDRFGGNFRGGPPTPMHPTPANDSAILTRRLKRRSDL